MPKTTLRAAAIFLSAQLLAAGLLAAAASAQFPSGGFRPGDLYLLSTSFAQGGMGKQGVLRIDPVSGAPSVVAAMAIVATPLTFDPFRDRLVFVGATLAQPLSQGLLFMDAAGATTKITLPFGIDYHAPRGTGAIYLYAQGNQVHVLRADDTIVPLLDQAGTGTFSFAPTGFPLGFAFDPGTNALFRFRWDPASSCGYGANVVDRVMLTADGSQVTGSVATQALCIGSGTGLLGSVTRTPDGRFFLVCDGAVGGTNPNRVAFLDPATLTATPFTSLENLFAAVRQGVYSPITGRAIVLDTFFDRLLSFSPGQPQPGTVFTPSTTDPKVSSAGASGEAAYLAVVDYGAAGLSAYGTGTPGCDGPIAFTGLGAPKAGVAGYRFLGSKAPPSALGLVLATDAADFAGTDLFGLGFVLHVDLLQATEVSTFDIFSDASGQAATAPFAIPPSLAGKTYYAQSIWVWSSCPLPPWGLSSSNGLVLAIQG